MRPASNGPRPQVFQPNKMPNTDSNEGSLKTPLSNPSVAKRLSFWTKMGIFSATMSAVFIVNILLSPFLYAIGKKRKINHVTGRMLAGAAQTTLGLEFDVQGEEEVLSQLKGPAIFVANHQTSLDAVVLGKIFPENTAVMAKNSLFYAPLLGQFLWIGDNVFVDRANHESAMETMEKVATQLKETGRSIFMFVEGTRSHSIEPRLQPFKKGAFALSVQSGYPIVPIVFSHQAPIYHAKKSHLISGKLSVRFLPPIYPESYSVDELLNKVYNVMLAALLDMANKNFKAKL